MYREVVAASPKTASARYELGGLLLKHSITHAVGDGKLSLSDAARRDVEEARKHLRSRASCDRAALRLLWR